MRTTLLALVFALAPLTAAAQTNTTGSLSPNTTVVQAPTPTVVTPSTGTTTTTDPAATTTAAPAPTTTPAVAAAPRDAAIVLCASEFSTGGGRLLVFSASTSAGVPTIAAGAPCAQALSDLFVAGFGVIDVLPVNQQVQYTLVR